MIRLPQPEPTPRGGLELRWLPAQATEFELLDRPIVFDEAQEAVRRHKVPLVVVGSAGSGKTAVTLAKMREATGRVLYVTHSAYLAQTARKLYSAHGYENPAQDVEFMSFREFVDLIAVPEGVEVSSFVAFRAWLERRRGGLTGELRQVTRTPCSKNSAASSAPQRPRHCPAPTIRRWACGNPCSRPAKLRAAAHELFLQVWLG